MILPTNVELGGQSCSVPQEYLALQHLLINSVETAELPTPVSIMAFLILNACSSFEITDCALQVNPER